jgi:chromosomal replication initiator protein
MTSVEHYFHDIWMKAKSALREDSTIDKIVYDTYFDESSLAFLNDERAVITVPSFVQKTVLTQKKSLIKEILESLGYVVSIEVLLNDEFSPSQPHDAQPFNDNVRPEYTFDNFIVGPSNKEAHSAALACAFTPGRFYSPLFVHGNSGLGKTHLLNAIGNYIKKNHPDLKVYYTSGSDFVQAVVDSIANKTDSIENFKKRMFSLDVLLLDDIQFIAGKEKSHEIFFHVFNELVSNKKQIVLTSDRDPSEIKGLETRLISRFSSGLTVGVDSPEFETALAILKARLSTQTLDGLGVVEDDVLSYIATNFSKDVRKLEGALNRLLFYAVQFSAGGNIDFKLAMGAFKGASSVADKNEVSPNKIKRIVADYYGLTRQQLISNSRTKNIATARHVAMYLCRKLLDIPFIKIGEEFGKRDHSTVMNACEKVEGNMKKDPHYKSMIIELEKQILQG